MAQGTARVVPVECDRRPGTTQPETTIREQLRPVPAWLTWPEAEPGTVLVATTVHESQ